MNKAILLSTSEKVAWLAGFTREAIEKFWPGHPAVFICGIEPPSSPDNEGSYLPLENDPRDWIGILHSACKRLKEQGVQWVYLILEDHPPMGPCGVHHLNVTLPTFAENHNASCIHLYGWGQGREVQGAILEEDHKMETMPPSYYWKFSLHPALWSVESLVTILDLFMENVPEDQRSPWAFERNAEKWAIDWPPEILGGIYRVSGTALAPPPAGNRSFMARLTLLRTWASLRRRLCHLAGSREGTEYWDGRTRDLCHYYHGPYPLYWSGLMQKGKFHGAALRFLKLMNHRKIMDPLIQGAIAGEHTLPL